MASKDRQRLFENIVRLRRAERRAPEDRDIVVVRADLERELGEAVSRSFAARVLGVSHTALKRWVDAGDIPVVVTPEGRIGVPVPALLDLYDKVERERESGERRHVLEPVMLEGRERAEALHPDALVASLRPGDPHRAAELRSLAYHRAVAHRLNRSMVNDARHLVWQWEATGKMRPRYAARWGEVLRMPIAAIREVLEADDQRSRDLRQNSPFAGVLSEPERRKILVAVG